MKNKVMNNINKLIEQGAVLARKHEELRNETLNDPNVPQEIKDALIQAKKEFEEKEKEHKEELEINKHKKIKGYNPDNFEPIYEDE